MRRLLTTIFILFVLSVSAVSCYSDEASQWYSKGFDYYNKRLYGKALECFNKALELNPDFGGAYCGRAHVNYVTSRFQDAISDCTKCIKYYPEYGNAYFIRGEMYEHIGDYKKAISDLTKAIELDPDNAQFYISRARLYFNNRKIYGLKKAENDYRKACELGDGYACSELRDLLNE